MSTLCYLTFPAPEIKAATDSVLYAVARYVIGKFPQRVIKQLFVDTQDNMRDFYKNAISTYAGGVSESSNNSELLKTPRPHMFVGYQFDASFESNDTGLGETQPYFFPNAFWFQEDNQSRFPILRDSVRKISIETYNLRIRTTAEFTITCKSREEQFTIYNYILNTLKMYYSMPILGGVKASYILPTYMMRYLKDILFGETTEYKDISNKMDEYLINYSKDGIKPVYRNNKEDDKFYEMQYIYNRVDFKLTGKPQIDDGTKTGDAADNFTVRFPATVEFYIPTNYVVTSPELIPNLVGGVTEIPDAITLDPVVDNDLNAHVQTVIKKRINDTQKDSLIVPTGYTLMKSVEFALTTENDSFNLIDCVGDENLAKCLKYLIKENKTEYFKFYIYEGINRLDEDVYVTYDKDYNIKIKDGDISKVYTLEIYFNGPKVLRLIEQLEANK